MAPIEPRMDTNGHEYHLFMERLHSFFRSCTGSGIFASCGIQPPVKAQLPPATLHYRTNTPIPFPTLYCPLKRRTATLPCGRARARQPRTPPSPLFPTLYSNGRPLQSGHALSSSPSSLLPTLQARPSAPATHSSLPSSPYSLLETCIHGIPCAVSSLTASPCSSRSFFASVKSFISLAARSTALP